MANTKSSIDESRAHLAERFADVRSQTMQLTAALTPEDMTLQSMPDASPTKWHHAHTTWFFETFLLAQFTKGFRAFDESFALLFNSYYQGVGPQWPRHDRGRLSRPGLAEVVAYRGHVEEKVHTLIGSASARTWKQIAPILELGLNHEQQHQELLCTDIKHALAMNPLAPAAMPGGPPAVSANSAPPLSWLRHPGGLMAQGHEGHGFAFDNERPRHRVFLQPFALASRPSTNGEYLAFIEDGGYRAPSLWLAEGWDLASRENWHHPLYWRQSHDGWQEYTLHGLMPLDHARPVVHLSAFEAAAFASWQQERLPTEHEWEAIAAIAPHSNGNWLRVDHPIHPQPAASGEGLRQVFGDVWEWTQSAYSPYPGFLPNPGAIGEYNGKFMINQLVLRGGSCASPPGHLRATYRNFFPAHARWQFAGVRLARNI